MITDSLTLTDAVEQNAEPLHEAPEPAPGDPLLTETENNFLNSFFDDITTNQYNLPSFGEGLAFSSSWLTQPLPGSLVGSSTALGQQPSFSSETSASLANPNDDANPQRQAVLAHMMPPPPPPPALSQMSNHPQQASYGEQSHQHQQPSEDVLHAAATLLQNGSAARGSMDTSDFGPSRRVIGPPVGHLRHQPLEEFQDEARRANMSEFPADNTFVDWMGTAGSQPQRSFSRPVSIPEYQWGSDSNFTGAQAYTPGRDKETVESHSRHQLDCLDCLEPSRSTGSTRANSPKATNAKQVKGRAVKSGLKPPEDPDAPPRKRRKSRIARNDAGTDEAEDQDDEDITTPGSKASRRRKPKSEASQTSSPPTAIDVSGKRRKSGANGAKAPRENLSEEQKRENHIRSEQKRRTLIKEGFDDLCLLVPGLTSRGMSKSTMLTMAAEHLEALVQGNQDLRAKLAALGKP